MIGGSFPLGLPHAASDTRASTATLNLWMIPGLSGEIAQALALSSIDPAIAVIALLACISLVTQGIADIAWPNGMASPIGASGWLVAPSGGGKSVVMRLLTEPIHRIVRELERAMPQAARKVSLFIEDATREAIILHLIDWAVAGLFTDEAGQLKGLLKNGASTLAKLTDGTPLSHARVSTGRVSIEGHRLTILGMMQPSVLEHSRELLGATKGGVGLINRCFIGRAGPATMNTATFNPNLPASTHARYDERLSALLTKTIDVVRSGEQRPTLRLDASAEQRFGSIRAWVSSVYSDPRFANVSEYISRHAERVLRSAGALHVFHHGPVGEVQVESIEAAHHIGLWSIESYIALIEAPPKPTQLEEDLARLEGELIRSANMYGPKFRLSVLRRMSPNIGLTKARFDRALPLLAHAGKVTVYADRREDWVFVNPPQMPFPMSPVSFTQRF